MIAFRIGSVATLGCALFALCAVRAQEPAPSRSVWDGVYTEEQSKRGETVYQKECASCHGASLGGGESAPPLTGGAFLSNWNGLTLGDLFDRIRKTMQRVAPAGSLVSRTRTFSHSC